MVCIRCRGLMVQERITDLQMSFHDARQWLDVWRCISCGNCVDSTILRNQRAQGQVVHG